MCFDYKVYLTEIIDILSDERIIIILLLHSDASFQVLERRVINCV